MKAIHPMAQLFATSNMEVVASAAQQGFKLLFIGDTMDMPKQFPFINAITFTPDSRSICALLEGEEKIFAEMYLMSLATEVNEKMFAVILGALNKGQKILLFFPEDTQQLKYPYLLLKYFNDKFGIRVGDKTTECMYNDNYDYSNLSFMYMNDILSWQEYILNIDNLDQFVLVKLRKDLCDKYNIPTDIDDISMVNKVQEIKHSLIRELNKGKKLFSKIGG